MNTDLPMIIRPATAADEDFIVDSWIQSYLDRGVRVPQLRIKTIKSGLRRLIPQLLRTSTALVAAPQDEPQLIAGWAVGSTDVLHYTYTRASYRRLGISTALQAAIGIEPNKPLTVTHYTDDLFGWKPSTEIIFNPYLLA